MFQPTFQDEAHHSEHDEDQDDVKEHQSDSEDRCNDPGVLTDKEDHRANRTERDEDGRPDAPPAASTLLRPSRGTWPTPVRPEEPLQAIECRKVCAGSNPCHEDRGSNRAFA